MAATLFGVGLASAPAAQAASFPVAVDMSVCLSYYYYVPSSCPLGTGISAGGELLGTTGVDNGTFSDLVFYLPGTWAVDRTARTLVIEWLYYLPLDATGTYVGGGCFEGDITLYGYFPIGAFTMCKAP